MKIRYYDVNVVMMNFQRALLRVSVALVALLGHGWGPAWSLINRHQRPG